MVCEYTISTELSQEEKMLAEAAREASRDAVNRAFAAGLSIAVIKDGKLVQISPDGTETFLEEV